MANSTPTATWASCSPTTSKRTMGQWRSGDTLSIYEALDKKALRAANSRPSVDCWKHLFHEIGISSLTVGGFTFLAKYETGEAVKILYHYSDELAFRNVGNLEQTAAQLFASLTDDRAHFGFGVYATQHEPADARLRWEQWISPSETSLSARSGAQGFAFYWTTTAMGTPCAWASAVRRPFSHCSLHCPRTRHHRWRVQKERQGVGEWQGFCTSCSVLHSFDRARLNGLQHLRASNVPQLAQDVLWALVTDLTCKTWCRMWNESCSQSLYFRIDC